LIWACFLVGLVGLGLVLIHRPLLVGYARLFRVDQPALSDALVVLEHPEKAAALYRRGLAPRVLLVATDPIPLPDLNGAELSRRILIRHGVPAEATRLLPIARPVAELRDEALRVRDEVRAHPVRRITVVVSAHRSARASRVFRKALRETGVEVRMASADNTLFDESNWYTRDEGLVAYFLETIEWVLLLLGG
jgi:uncharacterized SAM-binding protein YcdF (DUF218 family)